jgi:hypothetical protein
MFELKLDVGEIVVKTCAGETLHILEDEGSWPGLSDSADGLGEHIPSIVIGTVSPTERERLARWSARDEIDSALIDGEINLADIALDDVPISTVF